MLLILIGDVTSVSTLLAAVETVKALALALAGKAMKSSISLSPICLFLEPKAEL